MSPNKCSGSFKTKARPIKVAIFPKVIYLFSKFNLIFNSPFLSLKTTPFEVIDVASLPAFGSVKPKQGT